MGEQCNAEELRTLFLFEHLSDHSSTSSAPMAVSRAFRRARCSARATGDALLRPDRRRVGMSGRTGGIDVQTHRTSQRGIYCGAWSAYVPIPEPTYEVSIRLVRPCRFFVLDADKFARFMQTQFPMAVHLLAGHTLGGLRQQQIVGQRARLQALGTITAGLTHQLNNPAAATARAVAGLRESVGNLRRKLATIAGGGFTPESLRALATLQDESPNTSARRRFWN